MAPCPAGSIMLGGGSYWTTNVNSLRTSVKEGNGWRVEGKNNDAGRPASDGSGVLPGRLNRSLAPRGRRDASRAGAAIEEIGACLVL